MIHLIFAKKIKPDGGALFFLGSVAPDAVAQWKDKEITHFRNLDDRESALIALYKNSSGDFAEGVLLHLYLDWKWDAAVLRKFIEKTGADWFVTYRRELSLASRYAFHQTDWADRVWSDMDAVDPADYGETPGATKAEVKEFVSRNYNWCKEESLGQSEAFPPEFIEDFTTRAAEEYRAWITSLSFAP